MRRGRAIATQSAQERLQVLNIKEAVTIAISGGEESSNLLILHTSRGELGAELLRRHDAIAIRVELAEDVDHAEATLGGVEPSKLDVMHIRSDATARLHMSALRRGCVWRVVPVPPVAHAAHDVVIKGRRPLRRTTLPAAATPSAPPCLGDAPIKCTAACRARISGEGGAAPTPKAEPPPAVRGRGDA